MIRWAPWEVRARERAAKPAAEGAPVSGRLAASGRGIVFWCDGRMRVSSRVGVGSVVTAELPCAP